MNRDSSLQLVFSVVILLLKYNFCLCNIMSFIKEFARLIICLHVFCYLFCWNLAKPVFFVQFLHYCCQQWSPQAIFTTDK